jgi:hypothetical protein
MAGGAMLLVLGRRSRAVLGVALVWTRGAN